MSDGIAGRLDPGWRDRADPAWLADWRPRPLPLAGGHTEVVAAGSGPPLLLVPPLPGYKEALIAGAVRLAQAYRVVTYDLRVRYAPGARMPQAVADLERVVEAESSGPIVLVGHSLGGAIAMHYASRHPDRVRALILSSAFARVFTPASGWVSRWIEQPAVLAALRLLPDAPGAALAQRLARSGRWVFDPDCAGAVAELSRIAIRRLPPRDALEQVRLAFEHDATTSLAALRMPVLVVWGARDTVFAQAAGRCLLDALPQARHAVSPRAGHLHPMSDPVWFAETITQFVRAVPAG